MSSQSPRVVYIEREREREKDSVDIVLVLEESVKL